jgi:uncharacterized protein (DUF2147 family)
MPRTFRRVIFFLLFVFSFFNIYSQEISFEGTWKTIDNKTGEEKSIVEIWLDESGNLHGKVIKLFPGPEEDQNPVCDKCDGEKKDAPMIGLEILWDFSPENKKNPATWNSGKSLNLKTGVVYNCNLILNENGDQLNVREFIGFSMVGRSQTWIRAE